MINKRHKGFTIVEVLIVLAIGGTIMLVVFLSVPALQRNSRNSQRHNDIGRIGGAVIEFMQNTSGSLPTPTSGNALTGTASGGSINDIVGIAGTLSQYNKPGYIEIKAYAASGVTPINQSDAVRIVTGAKCSTPPAGSVTGGTGVSSRQIAIQYAVEGGGSASSACQDI